MSEIAREHFYERIKDAPHAARGFFETIAEYFERDNMVQPHYTDTNGGFDFHRCAEPNLKRRTERRRAGPAPRKLDCPSTQI